MKIVLRELIDAKPSFDKILGCSQDIKLSYRIGKIADKIIAEMKHFGKVRGELVKKYGSEDKQGRVTVDNDKKKAFEEEMDGLLEMEIDFDFQPIPFDCYKGVQLSGYDLSFLNKFIEEPPKSFFEDKKDKKVEK